MLAQIEQLNGKYKEVKEFCAKLLMDVGNSRGKRGRKRRAAGEDGAQAWTSYRLRTTRTTRSSRVSSCAFAS